SGWEKWLDTSLVAFVRKDQLQYRRRYTLARLLVWGTAAGLAVLLLARGADALPRPFIVALPLLIIAIFANPWGRLHGPELERGMAAALPVPAALWVKSKRLVAAREVVDLTLPLLIAVAIGVGRGDGGWIYGVWVGGLAAAISVVSTGLL